MPVATKGRAAKATAEMEQAIAPVNLETQIGVMQAEAEGEAISVQAEMQEGEAVISAPTCLRFTTANGEALEAMERAAAAAAAAATLTVRAVQAETGAAAG